jgi:HEAT repeat protein
MSCFRPAVLFLGLLPIGCGSGNDRPLLTHGKPVTYWLQELQRPDPKLRKKAVAALGHVGALDPAAIPALTGAVKDRDTAVRNEAILALFNIGPAAKDAIPTLNEACNDKDAVVRSHAAKAVERIQGGK